MKRIPLTQGQFALVDDEDFEWVSAHKWYARWCPRTQSFRAARMLPRNNGKQCAVLMHREITRAQCGFHVDHANHDTLDNRRANLRVCSNGQNHANEKLSARNTSGFKGVSWDRQVRMWRARLQYSGKDHHIGIYATSGEAADAYDSEAVRRFGEFALTNQMLRNGTGKLARKGQ